MLNELKIFGIRIADTINSAFDPFEEFTRPVQEKYPETLKQKALRFEGELHNFMYGNIFRISINRDGSVDSGDQCLWHGIYTASRALKYSVTASIEDLADLKVALRGMSVHQNAHGELLPRLIRGIDEHGMWQDDVSNDSLTGHLAGIYFAWKYGDGQCRELCRELMMGIAEEIINHNNCLIRANGESTTYGRLLDGWKVDPLRLSLLMAVMACAYKITGLPYYYEELFFLLNKYRTLVLYPKVRLLWMDTTYDTHRAALHLSILQDLFPYYSEGLKRIRNMERKSGNAWVFFLCTRHLSDASVTDTEVCKKVMREFCVEDKGLVLEKINSTRSDIRTFKWGGETLARQPLPRWQVGSQDFFWQRNMYSTDNWRGVSVSPYRYSGLDYLCAYWLGRRIGVVSSDE